MSKEMGPKERALREQREAKFATKDKRPSTSDLRGRIAKIKPSVKGQSGRRGR